MPALEILSVSGPDEVPESLWGSGVDSPQAGDRTDRCVLHVAAWAIGKRSPAAVVELVRDADVIGIAPLRSPRPDLSAAFPDAPEAGVAGMAVDIDTTDFPTDFELVLRVVLEDGERVEIGSIAGRHAEASGEPGSTAAAPTLRDDLRQLIEEIAPDALKGEHVSHAATLDRLAIRDQRVLHLGSGLGDTSREVRARGAALVDGFESDGESVRVARLLNAYQHATRVSFFQRFLDSPYAYEDRYDMVLALSDFERLAPVLGRVAEITDGVLVAVTDDAEKAIESIRPHFEHQERLGGQAVVAAHSKDALELALRSAAQAAP